jgi:hypothetical protein
MLRVQLHGAEPHVGRLLLQQIDERWQKLDHAGIDHAEGECAARGRTACGFIHSTFVTVPVSVTGFFQSNSRGNG